jgi:ABC-2 type transport system ATP-binding protein
MSLKFIEVTKRYNNNVFGVKDLNFEVANGTFGLLGKNGAGKTTLMRILATIIKPTAGEIYIDDLQLSRNGNAIRSILGYLRIPDYPDGNSGGIRTLNRRHPDTLSINLILH